jgi:sugar phosphate isomerase/epimerase
MKYSFMSFSCPEASFAEMLSLADRFGYDGVEPRIDSGHGHGVEPAAGASARAEFRRQAADAGVELSCIATSCRFADPGSAPKFAEEARAAIELAADVGAPCVRVFGGKLGEGLSRQAATELVAESLRSLADQAAERGVTLCMETHDEWTDPLHVAAVIKRVGHPAVAVNWDLMHPVRFAGWTVDDTFEALRPWVRHVHFHDASREDDWNLCPAGQGDIDHARAVELLTGLPYEGHLSGEWIAWEPADVHLPRELAAMKRFEQAAQ